MGLGQEWEGGSRGRGTDERLGDGAKEEDTPPKGGGHQGVEQKAAGASRTAALAQGGLLLLAADVQGRVLPSRDKLRTLPRAWKIRL